MIATAVLRSDLCAYCQEEGGTIEHVQPRAAGGSNHYTNRVGACARCNMQKGSTPMLMFLIQQGGYPIQRAPESLSKRQSRHILRALRRLARSEWRIRTRPALPPAHTLLAQVRTRISGAQVGQVLRFTPAKEKTHDDQ